MDVLIGNYRKQLDLEIKRLVAIGYRIEELDNLNLICSVVEQDIINKYIGKKKLKDRELDVVKSLYLKEEDIGGKSFLSRPLFYDFSRKSIIAIFLAKRIQKYKTTKTRKTGYEYDKHISEDLDKGIDEEIFNDIFWDELKFSYSNLQKNDKVLHELQPNLFYKVINSKKLTNFDEELELNEIKRRKKVSYKSISNLINRSFRKIDSNNCDYYRNFKRHMVRDLIPDLFYQYIYFKDKEMFDDDMKLNLLTEINKLPTYELKVSIYEWMKYWIKQGIDSEFIMECISLCFAIQEKLIGELSNIFYSIGYKRFSETYRFHRLPVIELDVIDKKNFGAINKIQNQKKILSISSYKGLDFIDYYNDWIVFDNQKLNETIMNDLKEYLNRYNLKYDKLHPKKLQQSKLIGERFDEIYHIFESTSNEMKLIINNLINDNSYETLKYRYVQLYCDDNTNVYSLTYNFLSSPKAYKDRQVTYYDLYIFISMFPELNSALYIFGFEDMWSLWKSYKILESISKTYNNYCESEFIHMYSFHLNYALYSRLGKERINNMAVADEFDILVRAFDCPLTEVVMYSLELYKKEEITKNMLCRLFEEYSYNKLLISM